MVEASPLHVMLTVMRRKWRDGDEAGAVALAKVAAPYVHAKVPAARPGLDISQISDEELDGHDGCEGDGSVDGDAA